GHRHQCPLHPPAHAPLLAGARQPRAGSVPECLGPVRAGGLAADILQHECRAGRSRREGRYGSARVLMKRAFDVLASTLGLVLASPLLLAASVALRRESGSPVIFRQGRVGLGGRTFNILTFRTMRTDMPGALVTTGRDPRITRSGQWLRSTKLDELPQ